MLWCTVRKTSNWILLYVDVFLTVHHELTIYQLSTSVHWLLFIHKILISSTCFEPQVLIFRRIQLYTCSIWYCHSLWEFLVACRYTAWVRTVCGGEGYYYYYYYYYYCYCCIFIFFLYIFIFCFDIVLCFCLYTCINYQLLCTDYYLFI